MGERKKNEGVVDMDTPIDITNIKVETARLLLRPWREGDVRDLYEYASIEGVGEMAGWKHHASIEESEEILKSFIEEKNVLAVEYKANGKVVGSLGLHPSWASGNSAYQMLRVKEIGYVLSKAYWGRGLMPEAMGALVKFCFEEFRLDALTCSHFIHNRQSARVIEKCGFTFVRQGEYVAKQLNQRFITREYIRLRDSSSGEYVGL